MFCTLDKKEISDHYSFNHKSVPEYRKDESVRERDAERKMVGKEYAYERRYASKLSVKVGDEVLVVDKNLPRYQWDIGRIEATYPGRDGVVRIVDVRGEKGGTLKKSVHRLIPLN